MTNVMQRYYFADSFEKNDKFTKDTKGKYPVYLEAFNPGTVYAQQLYRYAYNKGQVSAFKYALDHLVSYFETKSLLYEDRQMDENYEQGIPDVINYDILERLEQKKDFPVIVDIAAQYNLLFDHHHRVNPEGLFETGEKMGDKYNVYKNNITNYAACNLGTPRFRSSVKEVVTPDLIAGFKVALNVGQYADMFIADFDKARNEAADRQKFE
eukprot:CAMPEP_0117427320 /NCGR_PEP_ID=MMETSP0758-20121206/7192_1 /TAXON_ID=63605 /ORGANISM="Percolomonas cosmopolitus, Strain AE-1 (ATCC 50343)" /LENGTH=210 /DNA_ID=CAMNT_0005212887 /DNA_START=63 /DNA_END=695 /DNA_ORIENTATION=-